MLWRKQCETINSGHTEYTCGNSRLFKPDGNSTKPRLSCVDKLEQDSSMLVHTAVWSPTPSDKINLCHLHIANACNETKFHLASKRKTAKKAVRKIEPENGLLWLYEYIQRSANWGRFLGRVLGPRFPPPASIAFPRRLTPSLRWQHFNRRALAILKAPRGTRERLGRRKVH